jgi:hypothetical protein
MSSSSHSAAVIPPGQPREDTSEVVYLVRRPSYTLALAAPRSSPTRLCWEQAVFQVQLKWWGPLGTCMLNPPELEALYEDLRRLVEYLREQQGQPSVDNNFEDLDDEDDTKK